MATKALVTGAAGFIGSHLTELLLGNGMEVVAVDCFTDNYARSIKQRKLSKSIQNPCCTFIEGDLNALDLPALLEGVKYIFHLAGRPGVRSSWESAFGEYLQDNVLATQTLLEAAKARNINKFVYASSSSIYGDAEGFPTLESALPAPISPYGTTKLAGEHLCSVYWSRFRVPVVMLRYFTVYGPRQRPDMAFHIFGRALLTGQPIQVFGDGRQSREFTYVSDIVDATVRAAERGSPGRVFNIGGGHTLELIDAIRIMESVSGQQATIQYCETGAGDPRRTSANISLATKELGYRPSMPIKQGLTAEIEWLREIVRLDGQLPTEEL
jgi:UDP-glucose 4-epimerase